MLTLSCIGKIASSPLYPLWEHYKKQLRWPLKIIEHASSKATTAKVRMQEECALLLPTLRPPYHAWALCDERGALWSTMDLLGWITKQHQGGEKTFGFIIGGPDGTAPSLKETCKVHIALSRMTLPHLFVRIMLIEQIYRCQQYLSGHPYHRS